MSDKNIIVQGNYYEQSGNLGAGHVSESEIKGETKLSGIINEAEQNTKTNQQETGQKITTKKTERTTRYLAVTISGEIEATSLGDILQIQEELVSKLKNINIKIVDAEKGSIKLIFEGSEKDLERLKALIQSGELTEVSGKTIENVKFIDAEIEERELRNKIDTRNNLVQEIRSQNVEGRNLEKVNLKLCNLRDIFLIQANLRNANLSGADLRNADLSGADLRNANLSRTFLRDADLRNANLSGADLSGAYLSRTFLSGADLRNANLSGANLSSADLRNTIINNKTKLDHKWHLVWEIVNHGARGQDLSSADLSSVYLKGANLRGARLVRAKLTYSLLNNADLIGANLIGADLSNARLLEANLTDADLSGAKVKNTLFGYNLGISEIMKRDLESKGAIFEDSPPGDRSKVLTPI